MKNKLIALVEVLMVVSLLCTGYSSWAITPPDTDVQSGSMITYDVALRNLETFGLSLSQTGANNNDKAQTFSYCTVTTGSDSTDTSTETSESGTTETTQPTSNSVTQYTNTTLSMFIKVERAKLTEWAANDYRGETLKVSCVTNHQSSYKASYLFSNYMQNPSAKLTLVGYPNLYLTVDVDVPAPTQTEVDNPLVMSIPLEQLYNLVILDKASESSTYSILELVIDCTENVTNCDVGDTRETICGLTYTFTAKLEKNQSAS